MKHESTLLGQDRVYEEINPSTYDIVSKTEDVTENIHMLFNRKVCQVYNNVIEVLHCLLFFYLSIKQEKQPFKVF